MVRVGVSLTTAHSPRGDVRIPARAIIERAATAARAGLDSLFIGDHHATPWAYYQNVPLLGRLLAEWDDRPAGCLFLLPLWNPVLLAEQVGTLAALHPGRFILQCAIGGEPAQFAAMGADIRKRVPVFEESLGILRRLWAGEKVSSDGHWSIREARINPRPPDGVEVWIGGSAEKPIDRAARIGDGWLADPQFTPAEASSWAAYYQERCTIRGRTPSAVAIRRDIYVGESDAEADDVARPIIDAGYRGFDPSACTWGSIDTVAKAFRELAEMGYTDIIIRHLTNDQNKVLASMRRLAEVRAAVIDE